MTGLEELIKRLVWVAPLISASAICVSALAGIGQIIYFNKRQRRQAARSMYLDFVKNGMENPVFAYPPAFLKRFNFDERTIDDSTEKFEQYEWHISFALIVSREILESLGDKYWENQIRRVLRYHREYFIWRTNRKIPNDFIFNRGRKVSRLIRNIMADTTPNVIGS